MELWIHRVRINRARPVIAHRSRKNSHHEAFLMNTGIFSLSLGTLYSPQALRAFKVNMIPMLGEQIPVFIKKAHEKVVEFFQNTFDMLRFSSALQLFLININKLENLSPCYHFTSQTYSKNKTLQSANFFSVEGHTNYLSNKLQR